jgi:hypothetical protein
MLRISRGKDRQARFARVALVLLEGCRFVER